MSSVESAHPGVPSSPDPKSAPAVHVHAARLEWHGSPLFDALDFTMPAGRWTCLLGPSGVGKSTLLRLIAGLAPPHADSRVTCGDGKSLEGRIAYMAQTDLLLPWASVLDNVMLGATLRGERPDANRARDLLHAVGLQAAANARPAELSGGMRQRAALAARSWRIDQSSSWTSRSPPWMPSVVCDYRILQPVRWRGEPYFWSPMIRWRRCGSAIASMFFPAVQPGWATLWRRREHHRARPPTPPCSPCKPTCWRGWKPPMRRRRHDT